MKIVFNPKPDEVVYGVTRELLWRGDSLKEALMNLFGVEEEHVRQIEIDSQGIKVRLNS